MPKKTRAAASNAVAAEADSGDEYAVAPKGGETFGAELELRPDVGGSVVGAPYLSLSLCPGPAAVAAEALRRRRASTIRHPDLPEERDYLVLPLLPVEARAAGASA